MKSKTKTPKLTFKYSSPNNLQDLLDRLKTVGIKEKDYYKVLFELDYGQVYYDGDYPEVKVVYEQ